MAAKKKNKFFTPVWIIAVGIVLLLLSAVVYSRLNPLDESSTAQTGESSPVETIGEVPRVPLDEAKEAFDNGTAVFVDTRSYDSYIEGHIPGAVLVPLSETEAGLGQLNPSSWIIPYCT